VNPSGPRALVEPMLDKALKISNSKGMVQREIFSFERWHYQTGSTYLH
jgi:hypothetical protein